MKFSMKNIVTAIALSGACVAAQAGTYGLNLNTGFVNGGSVSGYFTGADTSGDGIISANEVTDFNLTVAATSTYAGFNIDYSDYQASILLGGMFVYTLGASTMGTLADASGMAVGDFDQAGNITAAVYALESVFGVPFAIMDQSSGATDYSTSALKVPEPTSLSLLGLGAAALLSRRRKKA